MLDFNHLRRKVIAYSKNSQTSDRHYHQDIMRALILTERPNGLLLRFSESTLSRQRVEWCMYRDMREEIRTRKERRRNADRAWQAMKRMRDSRGGKKEVKEKDCQCEWKRGTVPRNRAIKALLLASDRAARELHCFEFETSVRSESSPDHQIPPINWEDTRECYDGCTQDYFCRAFTNGALNGGSSGKFVGYLKRNFCLCYKIICGQDRW